MRQREKGLGPSKTGNTRGPLRLTSTNWLATPARLILLRFSHRCPLPLPHNVIKRLVEIVDNYQSYIKDTYTIFFKCVLGLFASCKQLGFCLPGSVSHRYDPIIYLQAHTPVRSHSASECIIQWFRVFTDFSFLLHNVWVYGNMCTWGKFDWGQ